MGTGMTIQKLMLKYGNRLVHSLSKNIRLCESLRISIPNRNTILENATKDHLYLKEATDIF